MLPGANNFIEWDADIGQLAGNFISFFEKLNKTLDRITKAFPAYGEIELIVKTRRIPLSSQVTHSLGRVYRDIFSFLHDVVGVFTKADGRMCILKNMEHADQTRPAKVSCCNGSFGLQVFRRTV